MSTAPVKTIPQPLNGGEIKRGIAARMTFDLAPEISESSARADCRWSRQDVLAQSKLRLCEIQGDVGFDVVESWR